MRPLAAGASCSAATSTPVHRHKSASCQLQVWLLVPVACLQAAGSRRASSRLEQPPCDTSYAPSAHASIPATHIKFSSNFNRPSCPRALALPCRLPPLSPSRCSALGKASSSGFTLEGAEVTAWTPRRPCPPGRRGQRYGTHGPANESCAAKTRTAGDHAVVRAQVPCTYFPTPSYELHKHGSIKKCS